MIPDGPRTADAWASHPLARAMSEAALQTNLIGTNREAGLLQLFGWTRVHHETDSRRTRAGFLDLCAVRPRDGRLLFAELKSQRGRVSVEQQKWIDDLGSVQTFVRGRAMPEVYVWRPSDWLSGDVERILR